LYSWKASALNVHSLGFSFALLEDDFRFAFALRTNRRGAPSASLIKRWRSACQRFDSLPLDFRGLKRSDELAFRRSISLPDFHLGFALHLLHPHGSSNHFLLQ